jgi:outer membrane protein OmpA-like peptidoglycan-associated protein
MKIYSIILLFILSLFSASIIAQNLVPNGSFEDYKKPIIYIGGIKPVKKWFVPNKGTPDVFRPTSHSFFGNNYNKFGNQSPKDGNAYLGIGFECGIGYEYISVSLIDELKENSIYFVSFYLSFMDKSHFLMSGIGIDLSDKEPHVRKKDHDWNSDIGLYKYKYYKGQNVVLLDTLINDKENWTYCSLIYRAKGGEKYLTIGNFIPYEHAEFYNIKYLRQLKFVNFGYYGYYIDNVSLVEIADSSECPCYTAPKGHTEIAAIGNIDSIMVGERIILKNVQFETGSAELKEASFAELNKAISFMMENPVLNAEINGHTDNIGDSLANITLSKARAESVADYLFENGISESRLSSTGFGSSRPLVPNNSNENRAKNRRVEIIFRE